MYASFEQYSNSEITMKIKRLTFYILILLVGSFLYLSIIFSYGLSAPFHVLLIWLMYDRLFSSLKFDLTIDRNLFAFIPCILQNLLFIIYFFSVGELSFHAINDFYFSWIGIILILVTIFEFWILRRNYWKFINKRKLKYT